MLAYHDILDYTKLVLVIDEDTIHQGGLISSLNAVKNETRTMMLDEIAKVNHVFSASMNPQQQLVRFDLLDAVDVHDDLLTMSLKSVVRHACKQGKIGGNKCPASATR